MAGHGLVWIGPVWCDGRIAPDADRDLELAPLPRCVTTGRIVAGRVRYPAHHERRLARDARHMGIGSVEEGLCVRAMEELGSEVFGGADGIVRASAVRDKNGGVHVIAQAREIGEESPHWTAIRAETVHEGPRGTAGAKLADRRLYLRGREEVARAGVREALLFDAAGRLVEGCRTNVFFTATDGTLCTPSLELGAVRGIARDVAMERLGEIRERDLMRDDVFLCPEIIAVNAVRGAVRIAEIDGRTIGSGNDTGFQTLAKALTENTTG